MSREGWLFRPIQFLFLVNGIVTIFCGLTAEVYHITKTREEALRQCLETSP